MSTPAKQSSRWGSFLQQAVAGVESRLDNILTDVDESGKPIKPAPILPENSGIARTSSPSNRPNDRLQERLARAVAAKNAGQKSDSVTATPNRSGVSTPIPNNDSPRPSLDTSSAAGTAVDEDVGSTNENGDTQSSGRGETQENDGKLGNPPTKMDTLETPPRPSAESARSSIPRVSIDSARQQSSEHLVSTDGPSAEATTTGHSLKTLPEYDSMLKQLQSDFENSELQRQEEVHTYIERIDALESKLQYLARESAESARASSNSAPSGSLEKKLADKEEQVALLMEEGQTLSKKELAHLTTIKKLRATMQDNNKELMETKRKQEKAERDASSANDRLKRALGSERLLNDKQRLILQLQKENESLKATRDLNDSTITHLKTQLDEAVAQGKQTEIKLANEALEAEKKRAADLEEEVSNLKIENSLVADRAQAQTKELREKIDKDSERARISELEMKTEQQMLESKLEVMRARVEEASSGATGDAQAKLLRQIETLQTQYAVASENWQGIETSLIARATNLEKERDEATRREAEIRRKARDVALKAKRTEDELEETRSKLPSFQQELAEYKIQFDGLQQRMKDAESALVEARAEFEQEKQAWQAELLQRIDEERQKWQEEAAGLGSFDPSRANSPITSTRRGLTSEYLGLQNLQIRRASARSINSDNPPVDRFPSRRPSAQPLGRVSGQVTPARQDSMQSANMNNEAQDAPSVHTDNDEVFENFASPVSPHHALNEMVSVSTAGAGPSIQLVERMSSAVRRLESEKVSSKDDLARLTSQRDEARAEIISYMKEVETAKSANRRVKALEAEMAAIQRRYETTLEMFGEKSERVDELEGDVVDLKTMYRELVERTVK